MIADALGPNCHYMTEIQEMGEHVFIPIPAYMITQLGWTAHDTLIWELTEFGSITVKKQ